MYRRLRHFPLPILEIAAFSVFILLLQAAG